MTNNPAIYGVSREFADRLLSLKQEAQELVWAIEECGSSVKLTDAVTKGSTLVRKIESIAAGLSAAPAVERQESDVPVVGKLVPSGGGYDCWHPDANQGQAVVLYSDHAERVNALQSTIARLEARIAELESGRGEPICYQARHSAEEPWFFTDKPGYWEWRPLFTAPPAPVAVVPDERAAFDAWAVKHGRVVGYNGWRNDFEVWQARACLDATAALNTPKPTEWYDVAGDDEGVSL